MANSSVHRAIVAAVLTAAAWCGPAAASGDTGRHACPAGGPCAPPASAALDHGAGFPAFSKASDDDAKLAALVAAVEEAQSQGPEGGGRFLTGGSSSRPNAFMTGAASPPTPGAGDFLVAHWRALVITALLLVLGWMGALVARSIRSTSVARTDTQPEAAQGDVDGRQPAAAPVAEAAAGNDQLWSRLVVACDGDPVRAAQVIVGECAVDPRLPKHGSEAMRRALARLQPATASIG